MVVKQSVCVSVRFLRTFLWFVAQAERTAPWWQLLALQDHPFEALAKTNHLRKGLSFLCCVFCCCCCLFSFFKANSHPRLPETKSLGEGSGDLHVEQILHVNLMPRVV